ncbi:Mu transposase domain-containing protein [Candidatus Mycobacterium methanotrophicum]|uniref:IS21 family transposase n=2 Tax=Candidatus Mycobacterium methanotrophicum TaxID=2943498 RepID=A0ABY4QHG3_9MYCO|nr:IS21 family transposase [Candidatus Mycobacterium methanotrophicum]UQX10304.1 IS21 family transposase [Candidatus Mycobacterium methanotrophicum]
MYREVSVIEVRELLRVWMSGAGLRRVGALAGVDRKTARDYTNAAVLAGLDRGGDLDQLTDELIGAVIEAVRPGRPDGHGERWEVLRANHDQIVKWVEEDLTVVKVCDLLARRGIVVPQRTLHRCCTQCTGYRGRGAAGTVPVIDGEPGVECQIDFGKMGKIFDAESGRNRVVHALIFTAVYSRHMFVWLTFNQTLEAIIAGCEAAWAFFGGVFKVLIPDNMTPIVPKADSADPQFSVGWTEYSQTRGFFTDPARVAHPCDKPRVERMVQYVRGNFFAGEDFTDLADAQARAQAWCADKAGQRIHGTTCAQPAVVFAECEAALLLPAPVAVYQVPIYAQAKVHRDYHIQVGRALYSIPEHLRGQTVSVRADGELVKAFHRGKLVKTHPRQPAGGRCTDPADLPADKTGYAMRDLTRLITTAAGHGPDIGIDAERLLDHQPPWTRMRQVYRLLGLVKRYGPAPANTAARPETDRTRWPSSTAAPPPPAAARAGGGDHHGDQTRCHRPDLD